MVGNFLGGGAAINALSQAAGMSLEIVDAGVASALPPAPGLSRMPPSGAAARATSRTNPR